MTIDIKRIYCAVITIVLLLVLSGCNDSQEFEAGDTNRGVTLTYWPAPNPQEIELADSLVRYWNDRNPHIQVRMQPIPVGQSTEEVLLAAIAAGTTPDVCSNIWPGGLHDYIDAGGLIPLDRFDDFFTVLDERMPRDILDAFRSAEGHYYQVPWKTNPVMMLYNKDILRIAGYTDPPATYSEYIEIGKAIRDIDRSGSRHGLWMGQRDIRPIWWQRLFDFYPFYIAASGGRTLFQDGEIDIVNEYAEKVLDFFQQVYKEQLFPRTFTHGRDLFLQGNVATNFAGSWQIATIRRYAPDFALGIAPIPVPDGYEGPVYTYGDYKNISIFSTTRYPEEAWEFVKFLIEARHDLLLLEITDQIPVRDDLLRNELFAEYFERNPEIIHFAEQAPYTRGVDEIFDLQEIFDAISQEYEASAIYNRKEPLQALRDAERRIQLIKAWNR